MRGKNITKKFKKLYYYTHVQFSSYQ